ncbi:MAG: TolC family protein, partial [Paracoccaceae bacterium]
MRLSDRYSVVVPVVSTTGHSRWWEGFRDPVLNRLIEEAGAGNLSLAEAEARIREAEAELRRSGQSVSGDGRLDLQRSEGSESGRLNLSALFDPFGVGKARRKSASARLDAARLSEVDARRRLMGDIAETYIDMRFFQQSVAER